MIQFRYHSLFLLLIIISLVGSYAFASNQTAPLLISATVVGKPIAVGNYLFWWDNRGQYETIYGYDTTKQLTFPLTTQPSKKFSLTSDGQIVAWVQVNTSNYLSIMGYDLNIGKEFEIIPAAPANDFGGLALANSVLYYKDATPGHNGLYALNLATRQEQLISQKGQNPVAEAGIVAWSEEKYLGQYLPSEWSLHFSRVDGSQTDVELFKGSGQFEVSISGDNIVWAALPPASDQRAYIYNLSQGQLRAISTAAAYTPQIKGDKVTWLEMADVTPTVWSVALFDLKNNSQTTLIKASTAKLELGGFAGTAGIGFTVNKDATKSSSELYLAPLDINNLTFSATRSPKAGATATSPLSCGQVYKSGYQLYDCDGRWTVKGVQFILPQMGINGQTFWDSNYNATASEDLNYWIGLASNYLGAKTLRIFVDLPQDTLPGPTSPATIYDFAIRASNQGMRLGVVLHNDTSWTLTPARKQWLSDFVNYFTSRGALPLLAYLSADNEINNHCGNSPDCYDNNPTYVTKANQWTADFTTYVKALNPSILITVGISTEKVDGDGISAVYDFFRVAGTAPSLAKSVDFLSPHNYGGGGYGIWPMLRYDLGYRGPIVLEEFGYPTDLLSSNPYFTEGPLICRESPTDATCLNTAPYFLEVNARSQRENTTDGFAGGGGWMLVDSSRKDCGSPFDFYTGLFAYGDYPNCGVNGTTTTTPGGAKATAVRLRFHYTGTTGEVKLPPAPPTSLLISLGSANQLNLSWLDNAKDETGFKIERRDGINANWFQLGLIGANLTSYQDQPLSDGTTYYYRVSAYNASGNSAASNEVLFTTTFPAPTNLNAKPLSLTEIDLTWVDNSKGEIGFRMERKTGATGNWTQIGTVGPNLTSYQDIGLGQGVTYFYRVCAIGKTTFSLYSNEISSTVLSQSGFDFIVTQPTDDGSGAIGTLSFAFSRVISGQKILIAPNDGKNTVNVSAGLPEVQSGVTLVGSCIGGKPGVWIKGSGLASKIPGLILKGNNTLYGLRISGFSGSQIKTVGVNNQLKCVIVSATG